MRQQAHAARVARPRCLQAVAAAVRLLLEQHSVLKGGLGEDCTATQSAGSRLHHAWNRRLLREAQHGARLSSFCTSGVARTCQLKLKAGYSRASDAGAFDPICCHITLRELESDHGGDIGCTAGWVNSVSGLALVDRWALRSRSSLRQLPTDAWTITLCWSGGETDSWVSALLAALASLFPGRLQRPNSGDVLAW